MRKSFIALTAAGVFLATAALAQGTKPGGHAGHSMPAPAIAAETPATKAYREVNARMHRDMDIAFTQDADADFVRGMIAHHQGAIDMAKVALKFGRDEQVGKWATDIIREQEREIAEMQAWLKKRGL